MRWPEAVQSFFEAQAAISSASKSLLSPACELSYLRAAQAFYQIQIGFATLPLIILLLCAAFWGLVSRCKWQVQIKDRLVLSVVVLLYLAYPTLVKQSMAAFQCERVGDALWLAADLQEPCFVGAHLTVVLLVSLPQILLYTVGLPLAATVLLYHRRERLGDKQVQFRWGFRHCSTRGSDTRFGGGSSGGRPQGLHDPRRRRLWLPSETRHAGAPRSLPHRLDDSGPFDRHAV